MIQDGWEEGCVPTICIECGAFGCLCDIKDKPNKEVFFNECRNSSENINGNG